MPLVNSSRPIKLQLSRDLVKVIKRGHTWVYARAIRNLPKAAPGTPAILMDNRGGKEIAQGYYDPTTPIAFRVCTTARGQQPNDTWAAKTMQHALALRQTLFATPETNAYRLFNGEGDSLPGLVCDIYNTCAVLSLDGKAPGNFWQAEEIASWLTNHLDIETIVLITREGKKSTQQIYGPPIEQPISFKENGLQFTADVLKGQKTGFFLDQRDNRKKLTSFARSKTVLNAFGYTGGFSVYAGKGGAEHVTTLDTAGPALTAAEQHWVLNQLDPQRHNTVQQDAFEFLKQAESKNKRWDIVILDPPSFAPSEAAVTQATAAYTRLIASGAKVTEKNGILAAASCSSHITTGAFLDIIETSISQARRKATILGIHGQPSDHPAPLVMPELRYLKFIVMRLD